ncbi:MAG TPA: CotH kinase family protein [Tepidisphaeraceae bacterium]|nr:CotH kinase family protein [Tepidisphaeraceae bacterium]
MGRTSLAVGLMLVLGWAVAAAGAKPEAGGRIFDPDVLWTIHLRISAEGWRRMQPDRSPRVGAMLGFLRPPTTAPATQKADDRERSAKDDRRKPNSFGFEYTFVRATMEFEREVYGDVGIRFKGNSSYSSAAQGLKRPFKLDFNRYVEGREFDGLTQLNLNNNAFDLTQIREALSYDVFRAVGVPVPRTSFAMVYLTVEGQYDHVYLGVYTLVEDIGKPFLKSQFKSAKGLLLKPEGLRGLPYLGENWSGYLQYDPKSDATEATSRRFIEFTKLIHQADDETFKRRINEYLAVDEFLRFVAVNAVIVNLDSILNTGHNFYMYVHPEDNKVHFVPWDLNLSLGGFGPLANMAERTGLSVMHPYPGENRLIDRLLAIEEYKAAYREHVKQIVETGFLPERMNARTSAMGAAVRKAEMIALLEKKTAQTMLPVGNLGRQMPELTEFVDRRAQSVLDQLAGKSEGFIPTGQRGGLAAALGGKPAVLGMAFLKSADTDNNGKMTRAEMEAAVERFFDANDKDQNGVMEERVLVEAMVSVMPKIENAAEGDRRGNREAQPRRPAAVLARFILRDADGNGDRRVSSRELLRLARAVFQSADKSHDNTLDEKEMTELMNRLGQQAAPAVPEAAVAPKPAPAGPPAPAPAPAPVPDRGW